MRRNQKLSKFILPKAGMTIKLLQDFTFIIGKQHYSYRVDLVSKLFGKKYHCIDDVNEYVTLPAGTILFIDKIQIEGIEPWMSCYGDFIIFKIRKTDHPQLKFERGKNKAIFRLNHKQIQELEFEVVKDA